MLQNPQSATLLTLLEIVGPTVLLAALIYGTIHYRRRSRSINHPHDAPPDQRGNATGWVLFAGACMVLLVGSIALLAIYGMPGTTGGTSESQQQTSGAPQPQNDINTGRTRQTTGNQPAQ
jgi:hypothetical protein